MRVSHGRAWVLSVALVASFLIVEGTPVASAAPTPVVHIRSFAELPTPLPLPYDHAAVARDQVARAQSQARASGKLLLIDLGGNWCADCRLLAAVMQLPEVAAFVDAHYVLVLVDVGRMDRNLDIPAHWGVKRVDGVPSLLVVDSGDHLINAGHQEALADARSMRPQALADWLAHWTP